ncbi:hypothetical protein RRG08_067009 [Elysia crispata]|uniref:Uncharacterized protein n=1 Tax=Elysia crispata TaxID=231223 RepID=A0AAE0Z802_9GAST|nr:hypothetical protein RRG08_067009 [Elysia crispata]
MGQDVSETPQIRIDDHALEAVDNFTYLGSCILRNLSLDSELNFWIGYEKTQAKCLSQEGESEEEEEGEQKKEKSENLRKEKREKQWKVKRESQRKRKEEKKENQWNEKKENQWNEKKENQWNEKKENQWNEKKENQWNEKKESQWNEKRESQSKKKSTRRKTLDINSTRLTVCSQWSLWQLPNQAGKLGLKQTCFRELMPGYGDPNDILVVRDLSLSTRSGCRKYGETQHRRLSLTDWWVRHESGTWTRGRQSRLVDRMYRSGKLLHCLANLDKGETISTGRQDVSVW